jgi:hypothetical protein
MFHRPLGFQPPRRRNIGFRAAMRHGGSTTANPKAASRTKMIARCGHVGSIVTKGGTANTIPDQRCSAFAAPRPGNVENY